MFTGIVQEVGAVVSLRRNGPSADLEVRCALAALALGESVAVDGVCLTVTAVTPSGFRADVSAETLARTTLGAVGRGDAVNIERALRVDDRLGGHIVAGHVDGVGAVRSRSMSGEAERVEFDAPWEVLRFVAEKGSIAIDGTSLTVNSVDGRGFSVMLVPFTRGHTTLGAKAAGRAVNLEVDVLARYVARALETSKGPARSDEAWRTLLDENGFTR